MDVFRNLSGALRFFTVLGTGDERAGVQVVQVERRSDRIGARGRHCPQRQPGTAYIRAKTSRMWIGSKMACRGQNAMYPTGFELKDLFLAGVV